MNMIFVDLKTAIMQKLLRQVEQHGKEDEIKSQMEYKLDRQLNRIGQQDWKDRVMNTFLGGRG